MTSTIPCPFPLAKILVCSDESPASQGAVNAALELARACGCRVFLLLVMDFLPLVDYPQPDALGLPLSFSQDLLEMREKAVREHLEAREQAAAQEGLEVEGLMRMGVAPHAEIVAAAEELQPDLIIMGRRGRSGLERLLVGSVTARVIGHSQYRVLVAPRHTVLDFRRILLASDDSPASQRAFPLALTIARQTGGQLLVVTVAHGDLDPKQAKAHAKDLAAEAHHQRLDLTAFTPGGRPDEAIIQVAQEKKPDLIIMGSHGHTGLKRLFLGSVAERVIGQAPCPVLVVK